MLSPEEIKSHSWRVLWAAKKTGNMRDRLEMLQTICEQREDNENTLDLSQEEAVVFQNTSLLDGILEEAHSIREETSLLRLEVERLKTHNKRFSTSVRRLTLIKQASDSIARKIHQRGEAIYTRLQALGEQSRQLEEQEGPGAAASRVARAQHGALTLAFHAAIADYSRAEELQRSMCRTRLQRQASILGSDITDEQLDVLVDKGGRGWAELSQSLSAEGGRSTSGALSEIKGRHRELVELEARMKEVHDLFLHMAVLVDEQGCMLNSIEANVCCTHEYIGKINTNVKTALKYKRKNPCVQCCPCLPCWGPIG